MPRTQATIAIVFGNDGSDVRLLKTSATLRNLGYNLHLIGWNRCPQSASNSDLTGVSKRIMQYPLATRQSSLLGQLRFTFFAIRGIIRIRPDIVLAVNEDNALRIGWLKYSCFRYLVTDVYDSQLDRIRSRRGIKFFIVYCATTIARMISDRLITTDYTRYLRYGPFRRKTTIVENYPIDPGSGLVHIQPKGCYKLFVSGSLTKDRGLEAALRAVNASPRWRIVAAGWAGDDYARNIFLADPRVRFLGHLSPSDSLRVASRCDAILAMYAPNCENHILASPNKIYDSLSVGRPILINREARVSRWVEENEVGLVCDYGSSGELAANLTKVAQSRDTLGTFGLRARELFESGYSWEAIEPKIAMIYRGLSKFPAGSAH